MSKQPIDLLWKYNERYDSWTAYHRVNKSTWRCRILMKESYKCRVIMQKLEASGFISCVYEISTTTVDDAMAKIISFLHAVEEE